MLNITNYKKHHPKYPVWLDNAFWLSLLLLTLLLMLCQSDYDNAGDMSVNLLTQDHTVLSLTSVHCALKCVCFIDTCCETGWGISYVVIPFLPLPNLGSPDLWVLWEFRFLHLDRPPDQTAGGLLGVYRKARLSSFLWKTIPEDCRVFNVKLCWESTEKNVKHWENVGFLRIFPFFFLCDEFCFHFNVYINIRGGNL